MPWSTLVLLTLIAGLAFTTDPNLSRIAKQALFETESPADGTGKSDNIVEDVHNLVQGVGFDVLIVSQKWGLVPNFCIGFKSKIDEIFQNTNDLSSAFDEAKTRLDGKYYWYDVWGNVQSAILSTLYYFGFSTTWFFSHFGMSLSHIEFYILPLPSVYLTMIPREEELDRNPEEPSVLYIYLEELGYDLVKLSESFSFTGPDLTLIFRTSDRPEAVRQWAWAKIDNYMENYQDKLSMTYLTMSAFLYLLRQADESMRYFGEKPDVDLDYVAINVGLLPFILNRFSMEGYDPAMFARDPCQ